jgi:RNA polymerase sigma-70 factor (sigma-E family)
VNEQPDFRMFVDVRWAALVRFAYALTADQGHAEDLVQHALERCWRRWRHVRTDGAEAYVRTTITRLAISRWRARRWAESPLSEAGDPATGGHEENLALHDALWRELAMLPPRMRAIVVLCFVEDLTEAQTAAELGCSVGSVKSQTSRAMTRLRGRPAVTALRDSRLPSPPDGGSHPHRGSVERTTLRADQPLITPGGEP